MLGGWLALKAAAVLLTALAALLLAITGWRPALPTQTPALAVTAGSTTPPPTELATAFPPLTVTQLRQRGRAAGLPRALTRSGRRLELLTALAALETAPA